jgi:hypothetical protein
MTTRERNLAVAVGSILGVAAIGFIGYRFVLTPLIEKGRMIRAKEDEISKIDDDINDIIALKKKYEGARQQSLPIDPVEGVGMARREYGDLLEHMCRRADLTGLKITANEPDSKTSPQVANKKPAYTRLTWDVTAKGDVYHLADFLRLFYSQPLLHTIKTMTVQRPADQRARASREVDVTLKIEALVLDNAPARPTLLPVVREIALLSGPAAYTGFNFVAAASGRGAPVPPAGVLADNPPRDYLAIAGKNVFFGPAPYKPTGPDHVEEDDISQFVVLTSITMHEDGEIIAVFRDTLDNNDYTITQSATGAIAVKGEYELLGKKKLLPGYSEKRPGQTLLYGTEDGANIRVWRIRRLTASDVIMEKADRPADDEEHPKPPALAFVGGGAGAFVDVPEGKSYRVRVSNCLATDSPEGKDPLHPLPEKLLRREAYRAIFAPLPTPTVTTSSDPRR